MPEIKTLEELRQLAGAPGTRVIIVCRRVRGQTHVAGYVRGFFCSVCADEIQMSPRGVEQVTLGGIALCSTCGMKLAETAKEQGKLTGVYVSPEAEAAARSGHSTLDPERLDRLKRP